jgi:tRNA guanosine-2'-O-methyltransferase
MPDWIDDVEADSSKVDVVSTNSQPTFVNGSPAGRSLAEIGQLIENCKTHEALISWMTWLSTTIRTTRVVDDITKGDFYNMLIRVMLQSESTNHLKYGVAILRESAEKLEFSKSSDHSDSSVLSDPLLRNGSTPKHSGSFGHPIYCNIFEIMVMGRYVNQVQESLAFLPSAGNNYGKTTAGRGQKPWSVSDVWFVLLFKTVLASKTNEQVRKLVGNWIMGNHVVQPSDDECARVVQVAFFDVFLEWAVSGQLAYKSLVRNQREVRCQQGELLFAWCKKQTQSIPWFSEYALVWLSEHSNTLNQHTTAYILAGLQEVDVTLKMFHAASRITLLVNFSPLCRFVTNKYCYLTMLAYYTKILKVDVPGASSEEQHAELLKLPKLLHSLRKILVDSQLPREGDMGAFLEPVATLSEAKARANWLWDRMKEDQYIEVHDSIVSVNWDRLTRYDPHAAYWKQFADSWPYWVDDMLNKEPSNMDAALDVAADCVVNFFRLSSKKTLLWKPTARALRILYLGRLPAILQRDKVQEAILDFINDPPRPIAESVLDAAVAGFEERNAQIYIPNAGGKEDPVAACFNDISSYGFTADETVGHAYLFDMLNRLRPEDYGVGQSLLTRLLDPWRDEVPPISVTSKWKRTTQLQAIIQFLPYSNSSAQAEALHRDFMRLLTNEPHPRYRFLLEWAILHLSMATDARKSADEFMTLLEQADPSNPNPKEVTSHIKLAVQLVLNRPETSGEEPRLRAEELSRLLTILATLIGSPRVPIRFEAQASFPIVFQYASQHSLFDHIPGAAMFRSISTFVMSLEKWKDPPEARILGAFDIGRDMNVATLFEGGYLLVPQAETPFVHAQDFEDVLAADEIWNLEIEVPEARMPLGQVDDAVHYYLTTTSNSNTRTASAPTAAETNTHAPLQTKSLSFDLASVTLSSDTPTGPMPGNGPILVGSLLEAPVNLGGLSRAANVFGCHSLHVHNIAVLKNSSFKSVSVDSELHLVVEETPVGEKLVERLRDLKRAGWSIVGLEQTSNSVVIGVPDEIVPMLNGERVTQSTSESGEIKKKLPQKSVIVMGAEATGIPAEVLMMCDLCVEIKQWGVTRSLNVQTAAACMLFEWRREWGSGVKR